MCEALVPLYEVQAPYVPVASSLHWAVPPASAVVKVKVALVEFDGVELGAVRVRLVGALGEVVSTVQVDVPLVLVWLAEFV